MIKESDVLEKVTIKFSGDSGDGIQLVGNEFTKLSAILGNDLETFPDFPAEIRAPAGTTAGISGFQIQLGSTEINDPGEEIDVLVAFSPAALKVNVSSLKKNGILIVNEHNFNQKGLKVAGYDENPLLGDALKSFQLFSLDITELNKKALAELDLKPRAKDRSKNFYVLGILLWLYNRDLAKAIKLIREKFNHQEDKIKPNLLSLKAGYAYAEASELLNSNYEIPPAPLAKGTYRHISGNEALALGILTHFFKSKMRTVYASYPITPASDILNHLKKYEPYGIVSMQSEDEMSAVGIALGASYAGGMGITASSGPGITLKLETINLAVMMELPLVVINVQRAGPSTGMPTKTEQADLLQSLFGRHGESHLPVIAASTPSDSFYVIIKATELAMKYMTPVMVLTDGYLANGSEPWKIPDLNSIKTGKRNADIDPKTYAPYLRDPETLARPWAVPGMKDLQHRIGGLEKDQITGNVNYSGENHEEMSKIRKAKIARIQQEIPPITIEGDSKSDLLVIGWGSTYGVIRQSVIELADEGIGVAQVHLKFLNPFPEDLANVLARYKKVVVAEINFGQLAFLLKANFLKEITSHYELKGKPLNIKRLKNKLKQVNHS